MNEIVLSPEEWEQLGNIEMAASYILDKGEPGYKECMRLSQLGLVTIRRVPYVRGSIFTLTSKGEELLKM